MTEDLNNPAVAQQRAQKLMGMLGSFWNDLYQDKSFVLNYVQGRNQAELQTFVELMETVACLSRFTIPIFHTENWSLLLLRKSSQLPSQPILFSLNGVQFGNNQGNLGIIYKYGGGTSNTVDYSIDASLKDVNVITDQITNPTLVLTKNIDFTINTKSQTLSFREDPFTNNRFSVRPVFDATGNVSDYELAIWLFKPSYDLHYAYEQFGYVLKLFLESSPNYLKVINAVFDVIITGSIAISLNSALAALTDTATVESDKELIIDISYDSDNLLILTDKNAYAYSKAATPLATINQTVYKGDCLVDAFRFYRPAIDTLPSNLIPSIAMPKTMLQGNFTSDLIFNNTVYPLVVTTDANNRTKVQFSLGGSADDINLFWSTVHAKGTAQGQTSLAQLLDLRYPPAQTPDPLAVNLPKTINPLSFLASNIIRDNALIIVMNSGSFGSDALSINYTDILAKIIPPSTTVFILTWTAVSDTAYMTSSGSTTTTGYTEQITPNAFIAPDPLSEVDPHTFIGNEKFTFFTV